MTTEIATERPLPRSMEQAQADFPAARSKVTGLEHQAQTIIRQRPVVAVVAALGIGFLVARFVSRATR